MSDQPLPYEPLRDAAGDPVMLSEAEYFGDPDHAVNHPHPQGWPCHENCYWPDPA